jgi:hypothetical protein
MHCFLANVSLNAHFGKAHCARPEQFHDLNIEPLAPFGKRHVVASTLA